MRIWKSGTMSGDILKRKKSSALSRVVAREGRSMEERGETRFQKKVGCRFSSSLAAQREEGAGGLALSLSLFLRRWPPLSLCVDLSRRACLLVGEARELIDVSNCKKRIRSRRRAKNRWQRRRRWSSRDSAQFPLFERPLLSSA